MHFGGSPPRVRGKLVDLYNEYYGNRITPACAGKTVPFVKQRKCKEDHPRVCGENVKWYFVTHKTIGSPPRVRGKLVIAIYTHSYGRITPACAGKTNIALGENIDAEDHPRVCGENLAPSPIDYAIRGSPPRVRGKRGQHLSCDFLCRITPACAGKTSGTWRPGLSARDHPRVCGEN